MRTAFALIATLLGATYSYAGEVEVAHERDLAVVTQISGCTTDTECEQLERRLGCVKAHLDDPLYENDDIPRDLFVCDLAVMYRALGRDF